MVLISFVRHGITDWNAEHRAQGQLDIPLNAEGQSQAQAVARRLQGEPWDAIYASDLSRAKATADVIGEAVGLPVHTDVRLREISFGTMEGTTEAERIERWGPDWESYPFGKEDPEEVADRGAVCIKDIAAKHTGQRVLVVSHGALIRLTVNRLLPPLAQQTDYLLNTSVTTVAHGSGGWSCELYNCVKHMESGIE